MLLKKEGIFEVDFLEDGGNLVVAIGINTHDLKSQVDLCIGGNS